jgi:hypothetical protein
MKPVEIFHIGPQKTATTWVYRCLQEHPHVATPPTDSIHYFDMFYVLGREWYESFFTDARPEQKLFDPTPSYIRSPLAPGRIARENKEAKLIISLRHPIERAFSHYWHQKKNRTINYTFDDVLRIYDLFADWLEPGFYAEHIERYLEYFPREQILCQRFEDLERNPREFLNQLLVFCGLDTDLTPSVLHTKINPARPPEPWLKRTTKSGLKRLGLMNSGRSRAQPAASRSGAPNRQVNGKMERLADVPRDVIQRLGDICEPEIQRLEHLLDINLAEWRRYGN